MGADACQVQLPCSRLVPGHQAKGSLITIRPCGGIVDTFHYIEIDRQASAGLCQRSDLCGICPYRICGATALLSGGRKTGLMEAIAQRPAAAPGAVLWFYLDAWLTIGLNGRGALNA